MIALFNLVLGLGLIFFNGVAGSCPAASLEEAKKVDGPLADFAINLYKNVSAITKDKNAVLSPASVALALALLESGASGTTRTEIANMLTKGAANADVLTVYSALQRQLNIDEPKTKLSIANGIFPDAKLTLKEEYVKSVKECFQSEADNMDYSRQLEESRQKINTWVSKKTVQKIPELFKPGSLTEDVVLVVANAIYFKSSWKNSFNQGATKPGKFFRFGREQDGQSVPFMKDQGEYGYAKAGDLEVLELGYGNKDFSMYILLPDARDGLAALEGGLNGEKVKSLIAQVASTRLYVQMPKFTVRSTIQLKDLLVNMGLGKMFSNGAEFGRMSDMPLKVSKGVHEAFINVNENGTEAAAATGFSITPRSGGRTKVEIIVDHPFLYTIIHKPTGAILFLGKVNYVEQEES